ncbi:hypothetical protein [Undibacterium sp. Ji49W]|uniref:hypothetical protein n=1 Tax=Undibacterium sp. Ji49W TaxID=3413040 RepID=UPI003BF16257
MKNAEITASINKFEVGELQSQFAQELEMRVLTENEILNVAGGPESDVGTGG